jgi:hypothetical protein
MGSAQCIAAMCSTATAHPSVITGVACAALTVPGPAIMQQAAFSLLHCLLDLTINIPRLQDWLVERHRRCALPRNR